MTQIPNFNISERKMAGIARNGMNQPLLTGGDPKRRGYPRCKSAPITDLAPPGEVGRKDDSASLQITESIFDKLHPSIRKVALYLCLYLAVGTTCFYFVRHQVEGKKTNGFIDSVYFCIVTMMTVGYGDLVPNSAATKMLACAFVFSGMALVGIILSKGADYLVEKQEILLVKALHLRQNTNSPELHKEIERNRVRYKCIIVGIVLLALIVSGIVFLIYVENLNLVDAVYCVCSTITTLGYGDKSFSSRTGRIFAVFWILASTLCLAQFLLYMAELNTEKRQKDLVHWVLTREMTNSDLEVADFDNDGIVNAADFALYKLKEMGKISQEDLSLVMQEFETLDVDQSGTLSPSDLVLAQSS